MVFKGAHFIGGRWIKGKGEVFRSLNPADGSIVWEGASASQEDVDFAMISARQAFFSWADMALEERIRIIKAYQAQLDSHKDELAQIISTETGKPLWESLGEVAGMVAKIDISIASYHERTGSKQWDGPSMVLLRHRPHGVLGILGPFNFPGHLANGHFIPALIAGNVVVLKPSDYTPMVGLYLAQLWEKADIPHGVLNVVNGPGKVGQIVSGHPELDVLCFTGSAAVGHQLAHSFARTPEKLLAMEMGGNNPLILHSAEDADAAALAIIQSAFATSGQRCTCTRRLIVVHTPHTALILGRLLEWTKRIRVGRFLDKPQPFMGPVISESAATHFSQIVDDWIRSGGRRLTEARSSVGAFVYPSIIDMTAVSRRKDHEYFGPMLQVLQVDSLDDAIREANSTRYGLASSVLTIDHSIFEYCSRRIRAGIVNWNAPTTGSSSLAPFGGLGWSGNHRPAGAYSADYCAYPVVSTMNESVTMPQQLPMGIS